MIHVPVSGLGFNFCQYTMATRAKKRISFKAGINSKYFHLNVNHMAFFRNCITVLFNGSALLNKMAARAKKIDNQLLNCWPKFKSISQKSSS